MRGPEAVAAALEAEKVEQEAKEAQKAKREKVKQTFQNMYSTDPERYYIWGSNLNGTLMFNSTQELVPRRIRFPFAVKKAAFSFRHAIILSEDGEVFTCGRGKYGVLGHGDEDDDMVLRKVDGIPGKVADVVCGDYHSAALLDNGELYTWGWGGSYLQGPSATGHGYTPKNVTQPRAVEHFYDDPVVMMASGRKHMLATTQSGRLFGWGHRLTYFHGQIWGNGIPGAIANPAENSKISRLFCGRKFSGVVDKAGRLYCWGRNHANQMRPSSQAILGFWKNKIIPKPIFMTVGDANPADVALGSDHVVTVTPRGPAYEVGGRIWSTPHRIVGEGTSLDDTNFVKCFAGHRYSVLITDDGFVYTWGWGRSGCLGRGTILNQWWPMPLLKFGPESDGGMVQKVWCGPNTIMVKTVPYKA